MNTIPVLATSGPTLAELARRLGLLTPPQVTAELLANTEIIKITVMDHDPALAEKAANTLAAILIESTNTLYLGENVAARNKVLKQQLTDAETELKQVSAAVLGPGQRPRSGLCSP